MTGLGDATGLVLAGGRSSRMGRDKALLRYEGQRLVDRAIAILGRHCDAVMVASGDGRRLDVTAPQVADAVAGAGPLAGIAAGLATATTPLVAVMAVDAPFADPAVLALCADRLGDAGVCLPDVDGVLQPLHAVWSTAVAGEVEAALLAGERSPRRLAVALGARVLGEEEWRDVAVSGGRFATSWNHPGDVLTGGTGGAGGA